MRLVSIITTGGTIEKVYDEQAGRLENRRSIVRRMLRRLRLVDVEVHVRELLSKDSLDMTDLDRASILEAVRAAGGDDAPGTPAPDVRSHAIVVLHGTDTLTVTGELLASSLCPARVPVVLTGAMRPFEMRRSDALQNLTEAIFASGVLGPGIYCVAHGRALAFPGVVKDRERGTFTRTGAFSD